MSLYRYELQYHDMEPTQMAPGKIRQYPQNLAMQSVMGRMHLGHPCLCTQHADLLIALHSFMPVLLFGCKDIPRSIGQIPTHD